MELNLCVPIRQFKHRGSSAFGRATDQAGIDHARDEADGAVPTHWLFRYRREELQLDAVVCTSIDECGGRCANLDGDTRAELCVDCGSIENACALATRIGYGGEGVV